jgi:hypothetical protein
MCCFSGASRVGLLARLFARRHAIEVSATKILARIDAATRTQWLVYSMALETAADVAMVLPLPARHTADDALEFVDLSDCPTLFDQLDDLFPQSPDFFDIRLSTPRSRGRAPLVVHEVGSFEASYVPSLGDMDRLDARFRISELVWRRRPAYAKYGFAVFKLKKGVKKQIHPMAMRFETADPAALFFPTVHVHDGALHDTARFDHVLYYQLADGVTARARRPDGTEITAARAEHAVEQRVSIARTRGVVVPGGHVFRFRLAGEQTNADVRVELNATAEAAA